MDCDRIGDADDTHGGDPLHGGKNLVDRLVVEIDRIGVFVEAAVRYAALYAVVVFEKSEQVFQRCVLEVERLCIQPTTAAVSALGSKVQRPDTRSISKSWPGAMS